MVNMVEPIGLEDLLNLTCEMTHHYLQTGSGKLAIDCKRNLQMGREPGFDVVLYGYPQLFYLPLSQVNRYVSQQELRSPTLFHSDPFVAIEGSIITVLQEGYGSIWLDFKPERRNVVLIMEQRLSKRYVFRR